MKKSAEIFGGHADAFGHLFQCDRLVIGGLHKLQRLFKLQDPAVCACLFFRNRLVIMCGENRTKELIHCAEDNKLVSLVFGGGSVEDGPDDPVDPGAGIREMMRQFHLVIDHAPDQPAAVVVLVHQHIHIEDKTFIDTVVRLSGMDRSSGDKAGRTGFRGIFFFVDGQFQRTAQNADQLKFHMPVKRHDVLRVCRGNVVIFDRKVGSPSLTAFPIINILHRDSLSVSVMFCCGSHFVNM